MAANARGVPSTARPCTPPPGVLTTAIRAAERVEGNAKPVEPAMREIRSPIPSPSTHGQRHAPDQGLGHQMEIVPQDPGQEC